MIPIQRLEEAIGTEALVLLSDDDRDGIADPNVFSFVLNAAEATVLHDISQGGYPKPELTGAFIEDLIVTLAVEKLYLRRREMLPGSWADRAQRARQVLRDIREGRRTLPDQARQARIDASNLDEPPIHRDDVLNEY